MRRGRTQRSVAIDTTSDAAGVMRDAVALISQYLDRLSDAAHQIAGTISEIGGIAEQTNLLALKCSDRSGPRR
jgi:methyl-accepting chemotaxis protein